MRPIVWLRANIRPFFLGFATATILACLLVGSYVLVDRALSTGLVEVTPDEVVTSAINGYLADHELPAGSRIHPTVRFLGSSCGGIVQLRLNSQPPSEAIVYVVRQDSGDALPAERSKSPLDTAVAELRTADSRCH